MAQDLVAGWHRYPALRGTSTRDVVFAQRDRLSFPTRNPFSLYSISLLHVVWQCGVSGLEESHITLPCCVLSDHTQYGWEEIISENILAQGTELEAYLIFVFFSPQAQSLVQFFSTQKRVNRDKTDFATKQRKLRQYRFSNKTTQFLHSKFFITHLETSVM